MDRGNLEIWEIETLSKHVDADDSINITSFKAPYHAPNVSTGMTTMNDLKIQGGNVSVEVR